MLSVELLYESCLYLFYFGNASFLHLHSIINSYIVSRFPVDCQLILVLYLQGFCHFCWCIWTYKAKIAKDLSWKPQCSCSFGKWVWIHEYACCTLMSHCYVWTQNNFIHHFLSSVNCMHNIFLCVAEDK